MWYKRTLIYQRVRRSFNGGNRNFFVGGHRGGQNAILRGQKSKNQFAENADFGHFFFWLGASGGGGAEPPTGGGVNAPMPPPPWCRHWGAFETNIDNRFISVHFGIQSLFYYRQVHSPSVVIGYPVHQVSVNEYFPIDFWSWTKFWCVKLDDTRVKIVLLLYPSWLIKTFLCVNGHHNIIIMYKKSIETHTKLEELIPGANHSCDDWIWTNTDTPPLKVVAVPD